MRILNRHIAASFLTTLGATLLVLTFVMSIGGIFKITELLARGAALRPILAIFVYGLPMALSFAIPISALTSTLLVFGRWSADGEVSAMRACGISLWQVAARPLQISLALSAVCFLIHYELAPLSHLGQRRAIYALGTESALDLLEEGRFIRDFDGLTIYIGRRKGTHLTNIRIYDMRKLGLRREIRAQTGLLISQPGGTNLTVDLRDVRVDPFLDDRPGAAFCVRWPLVLPSHLSSSYRKKDSDMTGTELMRGILHTEKMFPDLDEEDRARQRMRLIVDYHKRIVLAMACSAFVLLGIPLGIKAHRKESSIGIAMSLVLITLFYMFVIVAEALDKRPELHSYVLLWVPVVVSAGLGIYLIRRGN